ncbi:hypothetical protein HT136_00800 [Novosphingobium profundi]|uniref:hypothetical protein n=1 Tax=Novosphingobium profundi TaxID=1774954 RepID=UPI001BDA4781|nr:hypothetical protein [Novosphingobium profundi]MBT0666907.1 hypothetical protein [Novosphingobium profundi]
MAIRFAAARGQTLPFLNRVQCVSAPLDSTNDNADRKCPASSIDLSIVSRETSPTQAAMPEPANDERMLTQALQHFARHGLSAAEHARRNANAARLVGDTRSCTWWISICRQLDRRMAEQFERNLAAGA